MTTEDKIYSPDYDDQSQRYEKPKSNKKIIWTGTAAGLFFVVAVIALVILFQNDKKNKAAYAALQNVNTGLNQQLTARDSVVNDWVNTFNQIEKDLSEVKQKENIISLKSGNNNELSGDKRAEVLEDIRYINSLLSENKRRINDLSAKLRNSGLKIAGMDKMIADLNTSLNQRNASIDSLKMALVDRDFQMAELNVKIGDMAGEIDQQKSTIDNQTTKLNTAYVTTGSEKELEKKGLITKKGGFLGIGKKENLHFNNNLFNEINILETTTIPLNANKVELKTKHPDGSYKLVEENNKIAYLQIIDPAEFWRVSKYAVVETD